MTRRYVCLCGVLLLTIMGLAYGATLRNPEEAKELAEKVLARAVVGDMDGIATMRETLLAFPGGRTGDPGRPDGATAQPVGEPTREKRWLYVGTS